MRSKVTSQYRGNVFWRTETHNDSKKIQRIHVRAASSPQVWVKLWCRDIKAVFLHCTFVSLMSRASETACSTRCTRLANIWRPKTEGGAVLNSAGVINIMQNCTWHRVLKKATETALADGEVWSTQATETSDEKRKMKGIYVTVLKSIYSASNVWKRIFTLIQSFTLQINLLLPYFFYLLSWKKIVSM